MPTESEYAGLYFIYCTENHAFWTKEKGWLPANELAVSNFQKNLDVDYSLVSKDSKPIYDVSLNTFATPLYKTNLEGVALQTCEINDYYGEIFSLIDFRNGEPKILKNAKVWKDTLDEGLWDNSQNFIDLDIDSSHEYSNTNPNRKEFEWTSDIYGEGDDKYYVDNVYNIEVEDYHTYFVGHHGIWVHNDNCFCLSSI